jgi:hypothetical protein
MGGQNVIASSQWGSPMLKEVNKKQEEIRNKIRARFNSIHQNVNPHALAIDTSPFAGIKSPKNQEVVNDLIFTRVNGNRA